MIHANDWTAKVRAGETCDQLQAQVGKGTGKGFARVHDHLPHSAVSESTNVPLYNAPCCHLPVVPTSGRILGPCRRRLTYWLLPLPAQMQSLLTPTETDYGQSIDDHFFTQLITSLFVFRL